MSAGRNCNAHAIIQFKLHTYNYYRAFLIAILVLPFFMPQSRYILSNLHPRFTLAVLDMLEDYLCWHQTKLDVLSQRELIMLQNNCWR